MTSAEKIFAILETLCIQGEMSAAQLSRLLDINKGSVHRILNTLRELGYVEAGSKTGRCPSVHEGIAGQVQRGRQPGDLLR